MTSRGSRPRWRLRSAAGVAAALFVISESSAPETASAQEVAQACESIAQVIADVPSLVLSATDSLVHDDRTGRIEAGCQFRLTGQVSAFRGTTSPDDLLRQVLTAQGWKEDLGYTADGPDGSAYALVKGTTMCLVRASWDGGDPTDSSYVPEDGYELVFGCFERSE